MLFLGFRSDIGDLFAASSIVVLPSLHEGMSIALLEAMAAGKAIIATNIGGNAEATAAGQGAVLVPPKSPRALANAIDELVKDTSRREYMGIRASQIFQEHYTESSMLSGYRRIYLSLAESMGYVYGGRPDSSIWHPKE